MISKNLSELTLGLRKTRSPLASRFQLVQSQAIAFAKERLLKDGGDLCDPEPTDEEALRAINKAIKSVRDFLSYKPEDVDSNTELDLLQSLLPRSATDDEVLHEINMWVLINIETEISMKDMGTIMKHLGVVFGTSLDKSKASALVKGVLSNV